jgi:hypothetical protein
MKQSECLYLSSGFYMNGGRERKHVLRAFTLRFEIVDRKT